ncbi:MAG: hypothetical protein MRY21_00290 [Simkaniaceae bacterium]|nr:hypothetical protein [Simkaniaceae bacterium]
MHDDDIPTKANRALHIILIAFVLIALKVCYLTLIKHDEYTKLSRRPRERTVTQAPTRGVIRDRYGEPLALNKIQYNAAICYDEIRSLPRVKRINGKKEYVRKNYITHLAHELSRELALEEQYIEDVIYSKACLFPTTPWVIKEAVDEETYYRLKMLSRKLPGLVMQIGSTRYYPRGQLASGVLGYMGAINYREHYAVHEELRSLDYVLREREEQRAPALPKGYTSWRDVRSRYEELKLKSYSINTQVGKAGVEASFEEQLRGHVGKKHFEVDTLGRHLRELPDSYAPTAGKSLHLSISAELQEYAEQLLAASEKRRNERFSLAGRGHANIAAPPIKGGAIVAIDPNTYEVLCFASSPTFDPNDFIPTQNPTLREQKQRNIHKWLESERAIGEIWDGLRMMEPKGEKLTWKKYLNLVLSLNGSVKQAMAKVKTLETALYLQNAFDLLLSQHEDPSALINALYPNDKLSKTRRTLEDDPAFAEIRTFFDPYLSAIPFNDDKLLMLDLVRLAVPAHLFDEALFESLGSLSISKYRKISNAFQVVKRDLLTHLRHVFHCVEFPKWREEHFADFLKERREEEKEKRRYNKPYLDYLQICEKKEFAKFARQKMPLLLLELMVRKEDPLLFGFTSLSLDELREMTAQIPRAHLIPFFKTLRSYEELDRPLLRRFSSVSIERDLASAFYPKTGHGYLKSMACQETAPLGSIYKAVTACEAVRQTYERTGELNPLTIYDEPSTKTFGKLGRLLGYTLNRKPITRFYKGGRLPKSFRACGKIDFIKAMETSSNIYFSLLASEVIEHPSDLMRFSRELGLGAKTKIDLPGEIPGGLPDDLNDNLTGLYSVAIGQHSLVVTPLQTAVLLATLANGKKRYKPQLIHKIVSPSAPKASALPFEKPLAKVGIDFPFFTALETKSSREKELYPKPQVLDHLDIEAQVKNYIFKGLARVVLGAHGHARANAIRTLHENPTMRKHYKAMEKTFVGKTATAEVYYRPCLDREFKTIIVNHIWFGGIGFEDETLTKPDLVVAVYLRFGDYGKEAAPLAAEIIRKWREIRSSHEDRELNLQSAHLSM